MKKKELTKGKIIHLNPKTSTISSSSWAIHKEPRVISMNYAKTQLHKKFINNILQNDKSF